MAAVALVISLLAYFDQQASEEEAAAKGAAQVTWYFLHADEGVPTHLVVENRSLRAVEKAVVNIENDKKKNLQNFQIGLVRACVRATYALKGHGREVLLDENIELFYRDATGQVWRGDYLRVPRKASSKVHFASGSSRDLIDRWHLQQQLVDLDACG